MNGEQRLLAHVIGELAGQDQLVWHYCTAAWRCAGPSGLPDLVIAGRGGLVLAELKSAGGDLSAGQQAWQWSLNSSSRFQSFVWRPADWDSGRIQAELRSLAW